jgi:hypothetical protein
MLVMRELGAVPQGGSLSRLRLPLWRDWPRWQGNLPLGNPVSGEKKHVPVATRLDGYRDFAGRGCLDLLISLNAAVDREMC